MSFFKNGKGNGRTRGTGSGNGSATNSSGNADGRPKGKFSWMQMVYLIIAMLFSFFLSNFHKHNCIC